MKYLYILLASVCLASCDCGYNHSAYILDNITKEPIAGAKISVHTEKKGKESLFRELYTDSTGFYMSEGLTSGGFAGCPSTKIYVEKEGYITHSIADIGWGDTSIIYLEKQ